MYNYLFIRPSVLSSIPLTPYPSRTLPLSHPTPLSPYPSFTLFISHISVENPL